MKRIFRSLAVVVALGMALAGPSSGDAGQAAAKGAAAPTGPSGAVANATCLAAKCHGNAGLTKTIVNDQGKPETVPLYVDRALYDNSVHGGQICVSCHDDIKPGDGGHGPVDKTYGGWARFSRKQAVETISAKGDLRTRNYFTGASRKCVACHTNHADFPNSAHATIYKHRNARVDNVLRSAVRTAFGDKAIAGEDFGENYTAGDCNRCHASCSTCHFKSRITRAASGTPYAFWDNNQAAYPAPGFGDPMSEFRMDWTTNVASHEFRKGSYFRNDPEGVCEACHTGMYKPAKAAYYWADAGHTAVKSVKATDVKRHPQLYELRASGDNSLLTGGNNVAHAGFVCADCHGARKGDVHSLPGAPYEWDMKGDVQCVDCHEARHANPDVALHMDNAGTRVACVGCHAFGLARDFMFASRASLDNSSDVFLDPETNQVRPVVYKHTFAEAWYTHNWQTLNPGTGVSDPAGDCARKCHYPGNGIGASVPKK